MEENGRRESERDEGKRERKTQREERIEEMRLK
jgi:hypothetical protein